MRGTWITATVLAACVLAIGHAVARGDGDGEGMTAESLRKKYKPLDLKAIETHGNSLDLAGDQDLQFSHQHVLAMREIVMKKWRALQRSRTIATNLHTLMDLRFASYTMKLWEIEKERKARLDKIDADRAAEADRLFPPGDPASLERRIRYNEEIGNRKYFEARDAVQRWFRAALATERDKIREGKSNFVDLLDDVQSQITKEIDTISWVLDQIEREIAKRAGKKTPSMEREEEEALAKTRKEDAKAAELHLAPVRTEYEVRPGEPAETRFQAWLGTFPATLIARAKGSVEGRVLRDMDRGGEFTVPYTFPTAGTYKVDVKLYDSAGTERQVEVTVTVKGEPMREAGEADPAKGGDAGMGDAGGPTAKPSSAPAPIRGTFSAVLFNGNMNMPRRDEQPKAGNTDPVTAVPLTVTIDAAGALRSSVAYSLPAAKMGKPRKEGGIALLWRTSFELQGTIDWTTGRTHIDVTNGKDETGVEQDVPGYGHWKESTEVLYTGTLDGWAIPSPAAAAWVATAPSSVTGGTAPTSTGLEFLGRPEFTAGPDHARRFAAKGFFGDQRGAKPDGVATAWKRTIQKAVYRSGYGKNVDVEDQTRLSQTAVDLTARMGVAGWYLKLLDAPLDPDPPPRPPTDDKTPKSDLLAFGLWPTKPVTVSVGEVAQIQAMGVYAQDVFEPVDLSAKATWDPSGGLERAAGGFSARAPGTYTVTAKGPGGMTSTITVIVTAK